MNMIQNAASPLRSLFAGKPAASKPRPMFAGMSAAGLQGPQKDEVRFGNGKPAPITPNPNTSVTLKDGTSLTTVQYSEILDQVIGLLNAAPGLLVQAALKAKDPSRPFTVPKEALEKLKITIFDENGNLSPEFEKFAKLAFETIPMPTDQQGLQQLQLQTQTMMKNQELLVQPIPYRAQEGDGVLLIKEPLKVSSGERVELVKQASQKLFSELQKADQIATELALYQGDEGLQTLTFLVKAGVTDGKLTEAAELFGGTNGLVEAFKKKDPAFLAYVESANDDQAGDFSL